MTKKTYTDHHGNEQPFLEGPERSRRCQELREVIVQNHFKVDQHLGLVLEHARQAGDALLEVKRRFGHRTKWSKWRQRELIEVRVMSKETSCVYMRIAKHWNHDKIVAARRSGVVINSIAKFLDVLRAVDPDPDGDGNGPPPPTDRQFRDQEMRKYFTNIRHGLGDEPHERFEKLCDDFFPYMQTLARSSFPCKTFMGSPRPFLEGMQKEIDAWSDFIFEDADNAPKRDRPKGVRPSSHRAELYTKKIPTSKSCVDSSDAHE